MKTVRCKLAVSSKNAFEHPKGSAEIVMYAVYETRPDVNGQACEENKVFGTATPSASLRMNIHNPDAVSIFEPGKTYYVDITPVESVE